MKQTMLKITLIFAIIFIRPQVTGAVSPHYVSSEKQIASVIQNLTSANNVLDSIHDTLDEIHHLFYALNQDNQVSNKLLNEHVRCNDMHKINSTLRLLLFYHSLREVGLLKDKERLYPSINIHCVNPSCEYYVFAMRKIVI